MTRIRNPNEGESQLIKQNFRYDPLTGRVWGRKIVNHKDTWSLADKVKSKGYRKVNINQIGRRLLAHRVAYFLHEGVWPELIIDHINRIKDDNRWLNLRQVTQRENSLNSERQGKLDKWVKPNGTFKEAQMVGEYVMHLRYRASQDRWLLETGEGDLTVYLKGFKEEGEANQFIEVLDVNWIKSRIKNRKRKRQYFRR